MGKRTKSAGDQIIVFLTVCSHRFIISTTTLIELIPFTVTHSLKWNPSPTKYGSSNATSSSWLFTTDRCFLLPSSSSATCTLCWSTCAAAAGRRKGSWMRETVDWVITPVTHFYCFNVSIFIATYFNTYFLFFQSWFWVWRNWRVCMSLRNSVWRSTSERRRTRPSLPMMSESELLPRGTGTAPANVISGLSNKDLLLWFWMISFYS